MSLALLVVSYCPLSSRLNHSAQEARLFKFPDDITMDKIHFRMDGSSILLHIGSKPIYAHLQCRTSFAILPNISARIVGITIHLQHSSLSSLQAGPIGRLFGPYFWLIRKTDGQDFRSVVSTSCLPFQPVLPYTCIQGRAH